MDDQVKELQEEIVELEKKAREYEEWLLDRSESANWFEVKSCYDDVLFRIAQKKEKIKSLQNGLRVPETTSLPPRDTRHNKQN
jgi:hypothetical protein